MKTLKLLWLVVLSFFMIVTAKAQEGTEEKLGLPGDNLNLYAVLKLFQESETLEGFEKNLNAEESKINNLDLNGDNLIDYIKVIDKVDGDDHAIILQVSVSEKENQDVAVITVQRDASDQVQIQLIGDEDLYGKDYIIEPNYAENLSEVSTPNPGYNGNSQSGQKTIVVQKTTYVEVASWPVIRYIYLPTYSVWHSPWYWGYYPSYWNPWQPYYWHYYYGYHYHYHNWYHGHYRHCNHYRYSHWNDRYFASHRSYSNVYNSRRQSGAFNNTYSKPETRKEGTAEYYRRNPNSRAGSNSATVNRQSERPSINKPVNRNDAYKPTSRNRENKPTSRTEVDRRENRQQTVKPASRPKNKENKPSVRPSNSDRNTVKPGRSNPSPRNSSPRPATKSNTPRKSNTNSGGR